MASGYKKNGGYDLRTKEGRKRKEEDDARRAKLLSLAGKILIIGIALDLLLDAFLWIFYWLAPGLFSQEFWETMDKWQWLFWIE